MDTQVSSSGRQRHNFSKIRTVVPIPNLIEVQKTSYERFLQMTRLPAERTDEGLQSVFGSVFPISDFRENSSLEFIEYSIGDWRCKCERLSGLRYLRQPCRHCDAQIEADPLGEREVSCPSCGKSNRVRGTVCDICGTTVALKLKYDVEECHERGMTYAVPLKVAIRLVVLNTDPDTKVKSIRDIKEQEVYFGDIPLMTDKGTFIINGTERVIVSQLHRSPGAFFHLEESENKKTFLAQINPYRGSWVEFEYNAKNLLYVRIDRKRKFLATVFLRALVETGDGAAPEELPNTAAVNRFFYPDYRIEVTSAGLRWAVTDDLVGLRAAQDQEIAVPAVRLRAGRPITAKAVAALRAAGADGVAVSDKELERAVAAADIVNPETGEVVLAANEKLPAPADDTESLSGSLVSRLEQAGIASLEVHVPARGRKGAASSDGGARSLHRIEVTSAGLRWAVTDDLVGLRAAQDQEIAPPAVRLRAGRVITAKAVAALRAAGADGVAVSDKELERAFAAADVSSPDTREVLVHANRHVLDAGAAEAFVSRLQQAGVASLEVFIPDRDGKSTARILRLFHEVHRVKVTPSALLWEVSDGLVGRRAAGDQTIPGSKVRLHADRKITRGAVAALRNADVPAVAVSERELGEGAHLAANVVDRDTGEVILPSNEEITPRVVRMLQEAGGGVIEVFFPERDEAGPVLSTTLRKDTVQTHEEALIEIYRRMRPGDPPTLDSSRALFEGMFFNPQKYDFSRVGRLKLNTKLGLDTPLDRKCLAPRDFYAVIAYLLRLRANPKNVDDIDNLGNRRVRSVGELLENQFRIGLVRMERAIKEKMSVYQEMATAMPNDLINAKPVMAAIREFFGSSQLSQFMDQTNPLSEITHKRRLSALGPGGLSRERAGFEVRDVHPTHYGRICPIETPEGPNIGLISSLSCYARINEFGFIESPYRRVTEGQAVDSVRVTSDGGLRHKAGDILSVDDMAQANRAARGRKQRLADFEPHTFYLSAWEEERHVIAQANARLDEQGHLIDERINCRKDGDFRLVPREEVEYIDVSPKQLVSVAASLVPFLENDDANRALMGSNMQRQAVPLLRARAPFVGTGMEDRTARDSGAVVVARRSGTVDYVDSKRVVVRAAADAAGVGLAREMGADIYNLTKFRRSNQNTCINQKPIVAVGQRVEQGQVLADGPSTERGELALGQNVLVAFMPWRGYNFEDAVLVSERLVKDDYYTSIHIEEFEIESRDTKLGPEEITRDIPNVSEGFLNDLDESGIIRIGATVKPGDILVGKVTPKGETQLTPEEKLLRAIFGEKAGDVRDASLLCPPGIEGIVVGVNIFSRKGIEKGDRARSIEAEDLEILSTNRDDEVRILHEEARKQAIEILAGRTLASDLHDDYGQNVLLARGATLTPKVMQPLSFRDLCRAHLDPDDAQPAGDLRGLEDRTQRLEEVIYRDFEEKKDKKLRGDELPPGVINLVKVYVAMKRKLSVGDKMAGRHGNKGVIARVLPEEDMPHLPDGTPVEIVLNPLGVPSRMNVGQILETHLGWAAHDLGMYFASPVFDGADEADIKSWLGQAGLPESGKTKLYDGMTGEAFEQDVTVGYIYMLKLSHLVDDKLHARSIGPYSLITQQPLGGKAQFGGQRFGEMEVWALEAYGASHILQELLTAKSDDVTGRARIYEAIVKGDASFTPGLPESFNVLVRELQALCLDVDLIKTKPPPAVAVVEPAVEPTLEDILPETP